MEIRAVNVIQIRIVRFDEIPLARLVHSPYLEALGAQYDFKSTTIKSGPVVAIRYGRGLFRGDDVECAIERLELEERKIVAKMDATSSVGDEFYANLVEHLASLAGADGEAYLEPLHKSEESEIIARLEFSIGDLFSQTYLRFVESVATGMASERLAHADVKPAGLRFHVDYVPRDDSLGEHRITLVRKEIKLEARKGFPLDDRVYSSKAPFDTETHIQLLRQLEETITQAQP